MTLPEIVRPLFESAGWRPNRKIAPSIRPVEVPAYRVGRELLEEFEGLHVGKVGPGRDWAASDIDFNPADAEDLMSSFSISDDSLCPIGSYHHGHGMLYVDADGALYGGDTIGKRGIFLIAPSFADGVTNILLGIKSCEHA